MSRWFRGFRDRRKTGAEMSAPGDVADSAAVPADRVAASEPQPSDASQPSGASLPASIVALDIETTGQHSTDRLVSVAAVRIETAGLHSDRMRVRPLHLIFDPGRKCDPAAEAAHGYDDWLLRHQGEFGEFADDIVGFLSSADRVVAHNCVLKMGFLGRELTRAGRRLPFMTTSCTMATYRELNLNGGASLDAACRQLEIERPAHLGDTFGDAWLTLCLYLRLNDVTEHFDLPADLVVPPTNLREVPPPPSGALPPRGAPGLPAAGWRTVRLSDLQPGAGLDLPEQKRA
ncbi:DNA polymerase-3 subunit epsilon [Rhizobiales bacterium GAS113]|nr:DNA polymerase-3 subunit epsilon [Rhizobiales bacterium GAS113]